nr:hypothetical protein [Tanacetum cinerariifolium]
MHEGDPCNDHMPHETIHQTVVESWKFHYGDFVLEGGKNSLMNLETRSSQVRMEKGGSFSSQRRVAPAREKIVFFKSEELARSHHINETMLELKMLSKNWWDHNCLRITLGGCMEQLCHNFDLDEDPEEDSKEDPEDDHVDHLADGGDSDDEPSDDDVDDDDTDDEDEEPFEDEEDDEEE